jgi:hypothetical protein
VLANDDADPAASPYAPKRARSLERASSIPPEAEAAKPAPGEIQRRIVADQELARIEATLRLLQRREIGARRLPRGPNLPVPGHPGIAAADRSGASDGNREPAIEWFARPPSLEPTRMPPPPIKPNRTLHVSLLLTIVCFAAGAVAYYAFMPARSPQSAATTQFSSARPSPRARTSQPQGPSQSEAHSQAQPEWPERSVSRSSATQIELARIETSEPSAPSPAAVISARHSLAEAEPADEDNAASRPAIAVPALEPEEIDVLIAQGQKFIADGDIVTARLIFERAARAGNATAALALAAAYDPIMLSKLGVLGVDTDMEKALLWYQRAQTLGSAQAIERLRALAER